MATKIKVPGVLTVGTGDHYGTTDGIKDLALGKMQNEINREADVDEMTKSSYDALDEAGKKAAREAHTWFVVTE